MDGDEYDLIPVAANLHPPRTVAPGEYTSTPRKLLDRPSNIDDVADFVVDYINNDMYVKFFPLSVVATDRNDDEGWVLSLPISS